MVFVLHPGQCLLLRMPCVLQCCSLSNTFKMDERNSKQELIVKISCNVFDILPIAKVFAELYNSRHSDGTDYRTLES